MLCENETQTRQDKGMAIHYEYLYHKCKKKFNFCRKQIVDRGKSHLSTTTTANNILLLLSINKATTNNLFQFSNTKAQKLYVTQYLLIVSILKYFIDQKLNVQLKFTNVTCEEDT